MVWALADESLQRRLREELGADYAARWHVGLPVWSDCPAGINIRLILWLRTLVRAYGMHEFAAERYGSFPKVLTEGKQASWYPGGRADQALELSAEIKKVRRLELHERAGLFAARDSGHWAAWAPAALEQRRFAGVRDKRVGRERPRVAGRDARAPRRRQGPAAGPSEGASTTIGCLCWRQM